MFALGWIYYIPTWYIYPNHRDRDLNGTMPYRPTFPLALIRTP